MLNPDHTCIKNFYWKSPKSGRHLKTKRDSNTASEHATLRFSQRAAVFVLAHKEHATQLYLQNSLPSSKRSPRPSPHSNSVHSTQPRRPTYGIPQHAPLCRGYHRYCQRCCHVTIGDPYYVEALPTKREEKQWYGRR